MCEWCVFQPELMECRRWRRDIVLDYRNGTVAGSTCNSLLRTETRPTHLTARWRTCIADAFAVPSVRGIYLYGVLPTMRLASRRKFLSPMRSSSGDHIFRSTSAWSASAQPCAPRRFICRLGVGEENEASSIGARGMREPNCHWCRRVRVRQRVSLAQSQTKRDRPT